MNEYKIPRIASTVLLINEKNEVFLMRRSKNTRNGQGLWSIPGGAIEIQETVEQSLIRECKEECDIIIKNPEYIGYIDHLMPKIGQHWVSHAFVVYEWVGEPTNLEPLKCDEIGWFPLNSLPTDSTIILTRSLELLNNHQTT